MLAALYVPAALIGLALCVLYAAEAVRMIGGEW